jgi:hypothetical protein
MDKVYLEFGKNDLADEGYPGFVVRIEQDQDTDSPRDWCNMGKMVCWHRRYILGDEQPREDPADYYDSKIKPVLKAGGICLPLYLYDHGGITMRTGSFSDPWDSGQVGWIYATAKEIRDSFLCKRITKSIRERATKSLIGEVDTYAQFLEGRVYYVNIEYEGEHLDSCGGIYDDSSGFFYIWTEYVAPAIEGKMEERRLAWRAALKEARERRYWEKREVLTKC